MSLSYNVKANVATVNVSNTESVVSSTLFIPSGSIAVGDVIKITLETYLANTIPTPGFNFNVRVGANGAVSDASLFNANNMLIPSMLFNDANNWAQSNPGLNGTQYQLLGSPANAANFPAITTAHQKLEGTILAVAISQAANTTNLAFIAEPVQANLNFDGNLLKTMRNKSNNGILGYGVFQSNVGAFVCVTANVSPPLSLQYAGPGAGNTSTPQASFKLVTGANSNGSVVFSQIEAC